MERWLLTYADMITLLLIFFIMMYVISNINSQKFQELSNVLGAAFGNPAETIMPNPGNSILQKQVNNSNTADTRPDGPDRGTIATVFSNERHCRAGQYPDGRAGPGHQPAGYDSFCQRFRRC